MRFGRLEVNCGPMFAGKTEFIVKEVLFQTYFDTDSTTVGVFKPEFDTRFAPGEIVSHNGKSVIAVPISEPPSDIVGRFRSVFFDEVQFFMDPYFAGDFVAMVRDIRAHGTDVYCSGLDMDTSGRAFEVTAALMAELTTINRLTARCSRCGSPATRTSLIDHGGPRIQLGDKKKYEPLCLTHWFDSNPLPGGNA